MNEYSKIVIEEYCRTHNSANCRRPARPVRLSYDPGGDVTDNDAIFLERAIQSTRDLEVRNALEDMDDYLLGW